MTNEEAIKCIVEHMTIHKMNEPRAIKISMALQMAICLLEKQVPKKPLYVDERYMDWICPLCMRSFIGSPRIPNYCPDCGQKITWEEEQ